MIKITKLSKFSLPAIPLPLHSTNHHTITPTHHQNHFWISSQRTPREKHEMHEKFPRIGASRMALWIAALPLHSALVPRAATVQRHQALPRAAPQMLFNLGADKGAQDLVIEDRPAAVVDPSLATPEEGYENPGKIVVNEIEIAERTAKLDALAAKWRRRQEELEWDQGLNVGWVFKAETINGRLAMFFLITGLITEYYTGESIPQQTLTMFRTLGIID